MEIIGYSERGAMNALFYGIAYCLDDEEANRAMNQFLKLSGIEESYSDFKLYMEFSLSDFGDPDLVFTANNSKGKKEIFFVEAKVSAGNEYNLEKQKERFEDYVSGKSPKGNSSNLFFQLSEKYLLLKYGPNADGSITIIDRKRKIGENEIVLKFLDEILKDNEEKRAMYIAIIPKQQEQKATLPKQQEQKEKLEVTINQDDTFVVNTVSWEKIYEDETLKPFVKSTLLFNQGEKKSQICSNPHNVKK